MVESVKLSDHNADVVTFTNLAAQFKKEIIAKHITTYGIVDGDTQCAYAYVTRNGLYLPKQKDAIRKNFKNRIISDNYSVLTGFHGTGNLLQGLTTMGIINEASKRIVNENSPS